MRYAALMDSASTIQVIHPPRERWGNVLNLVLSKRPFAERIRLAEGLIKQAPPAARDAGFTGLLEARAGDTTLGATLAVIQPGRTALVYQPRLIAGADPQARALLRAGRDAFLQKHDVCLAQEVLPLDALDDATTARADGYNIAVELLYLAADRATFPSTPPAGELRLEPYQAGQEQRLADILIRTYIRTLDCPEINGVRSAIETIDGYASAGKYDPLLWGLLRHCKQDVGCVIVAQHEGGAAELVYVGLVPEARGRGLAREAIAWAMWLARCADCGLISVAVDQRNTPARKVYATSGFTQFDARRVMLRVMPRDTTLAPTHFP